MMELRHYSFGHRDNLGKGGTMPGRQLSTALQLIRGSLYPGGAGGLSDAHLLERWTLCRDEVAFELLLRRHGPMVFAVCRRLLASAQDAEDAFQATFLILVRRANAIRKHTALGSWLYKVAYRVALRARHKPGLPTTPSDLDTLRDERERAEEVLWNDLRPVLDEEVIRLPPRYREVFVLCQLQGKTNNEAARELGCPLGTVVSRLSRARNRLRDRLTQRGVTVSVAALTALLAPQAGAAPPPLLVSAALRLALATAGLGATAGVPVPAGVSALCQGVLHTMFVTKMKIAFALLLVVGLTALTGGLTAYQLQARERSADQATVQQQPTAPPQKTSDDQGQSKEHPQSTGDDKQGVAKPGASADDKKNLQMKGKFKLIFKFPDNLDKLVRDLVERKKTDAECIEALSLATLGRFPTTAETEFLIGHLAQHKEKREAGLEAILSLLTNTKEFSQHLHRLQQRGPKAASKDGAHNGVLPSELIGILQMEPLDVHVIRRAVSDPRMH
jgi:RNA polymerase sigma factor (sigma-70 family)